MACSKEGSQYILPDFFAEHLPEANLSHFMLGPYEVGESLAVTHGHTGHSYASASGSSPKLAEGGFGPFVNWEPQFWCGESQLLSLEKMLAFQENE